jgi:cellulose synthase/poly-beta-1,6-N-acetylglucosamine synthase-like glycosyltransferase
MQLALKIFLPLGIGLLAQSAAALFDGFSFLRYVRLGRRRLLNNFTPPAAVIIPCKGIDKDFERNVRSYLNQDYPRYQVIFTVASKDDAAYQAFRRRIETAEKGNQDAEARGPGAARLSLDGSRESESGGVHAALVVAGYSESRGEKVHNLLKGLEAVDAKVEVLVFADIDAHPDGHWLRSLVAPLEDPNVTVSTGFRWYLPGAEFVSRLRAAWDTSIATLLGDHNHNFAWGGSMAVRAHDFRRLAVAERYWANAISDDFTLTRAVREAGGKIRFEPRCLVASREASPLGQFLSWANRQIIITRVYSPGLWWKGMAADAFYCGTMLLGLTMLVLPGLSGGERLLVAGILLAILLLGAGKGRIRAIVASELFPGEDSCLSRYGACYWRLSPLVPWVMLANFLVACMTRRIEWRGTHYEMKSWNETRVLRREK